jgi:hypothetical protein
MGIGQRRESAISADPKFVKKSFQIKKLAALT